MARTAHYKSLSDKKNKDQNRGKPYATPTDKRKQKVRDGKKPSGGGAPMVMKCYRCG